jgi:hypothetical protein
MGEDFGSRRTFERWHRGLRIIDALEWHDLITEEQGHEYWATAITEATRPNGTVNVSKYLQYIEDLARTKGLWSDG